MSLARASIASVRISLTSAHDRGLLRGFRVFGTVELQLVEHLDVAQQHALLRDQVVDRLGTDSQVPPNELRQLFRRHNGRSHTQTRRGTHRIHRVQIERIAHRQHERSPLHPQRKDLEPVYQTDRKRLEQLEVRLGLAQVHRLQPQGAGHRGQDLRF